MSVGPAPGPASPVMQVERLASPVDAVVELPGSKSETNRALVCAALAEGTSRLERTLFADDTEAMLGCLAALGLGLVTDAAAGTVEITGVAGSVPPGPASVDVRMSGTTARFVVPLLACGHGDYTVDADPSMRVRPMGPLFDGLRAMGAARIRSLDAPGYLPAVVEALGPVGGRVELPGDTSSQFLSGLMLSAPLRSGGLTIELTTDLVSRPYVEMTAAVMDSFGVSVGFDATPAGRDLILVPEGRYVARTHHIEPDASAASYFLAAPALLGGRVTVPGLGARSMQGDVAFAELLARMGADVDLGPHSITVTGTGRLRGIDADLRDISDTAQTLGAVAAFADGPTRITGIGFIRGKETDRIAAMVAELNRVGVRAIATDDGFEVHPAATPPDPEPVVVRTYRDHRMAMSMALVALARGGVAIADPGCVGKTLPGFWDVLRSIGATCAGPEEVEDD